MIITALFNDFYRALVLGLLSVLLTYSTRNSELKKRITVSCIYLACVAAVFAWVFFLLTFDNDPDAVPIVLVWVIKWICYFLAITIIQHFIYKIFGKGKDIGLLVLNTAVVLVMCQLAINYIK